MIAAYVNGGEEALQFCVKGRGANNAILSLADDVREKCDEEHQYIKSLQGILRPLGR
jgi:hypothetical protein